MTPVRRCGGGLREPLERIYAPSVQRGSLAFRGFSRANDEEHVACNSRCCNDLASTAYAGESPECKKMCFLANFALESDWRCD